MEAGDHVDLESLFLAGEQRAAGSEAWQRIPLWGRALWGDGQHSPEQVLCAVLLRETL